MSRIRNERARAPARARFRACLVAGLLALSCGANDEEARLEALNQELGSLREALPELRDRITNREAAAQSAQDELADARGRLRKSEKRIAEIEKEIGSQATDPLLFRMVQTQLLEDDELENVAITARVERGVVTLSGVVPKEDLRDRAVKLAESVPGVVSVQNRIQVAGAKPAAP